MPKESQHDLIRERLAEYGEFVSYMAMASEDQKQVVEIIETMLGHSILDAVTAAIDEALQRNAQP